jgi:branched-chain amino acid transport system ATP-binding protein
MVPEGRRIFPRLTVKENLLIGAYTPEPVKRQMKPAKNIYNLFPILAERANQLGTNLSGGEQQMLAIGRALMSEPKLILFDEISLGLAPLIIKNIYDKVRDINQEGITVVLVEQDIKRSLKASSHTFIFQEGHMVEGDPAVLTEEEVKKAYFGL